MGQFVSDSYYNFDSGGSDDSDSGGSSTTSTSTTSTSSTNDSSGGGSSDSDDDLTGMEQWEKEHGVDVTPDSGQDFGPDDDEENRQKVQDIQNEEATDNWSGDETRADVQAGYAYEAGAISQETEQSLNEEFASNDVGAGDSGENTTADKIEGALEKATQLAESAPDMGNLVGDDSSGSSGSVGITSTSGQSSSSGPEIPSADTLTQEFENLNEKQKAGIGVAAVVVGYLAFGGA